MKALTKIVEKELKCYLNKFSSKIVKFKTDGKYKCNH